MCVYIYIYSRDWIPHSWICLKSFAQFGLVLQGSLIYKILLNDHSENKIDKWQINLKLQFWVSMFSFLECKMASKHQTWQERTSKYKSVVMVILIRKMHDWFNHSSNICQGSDFPNPKWILSKLTPDCYDYSGVFYYWTRKFLQFNHFSSVSTWNLENHPGQSVRSRLVLPIIECSMFRNIKMEHSSFE